jgi:hypothetical protein
MLSLFEVTMKSLIYSILLVVILPLIACAAPSKVLPTEDVHDFGSVPAGPVLEHTFSFRNAGGQVLVIRKVTAT